MELFKNELLTNFIKENNLKEEDLINYICELKLYLKNPSKYNLIWDDGVIIDYIEEVVNPGIYYLNESFFKEDIDLNTIDYSINFSKKKAIKSFLENPNSIYITGNNGIGKTTLAISFANKKYKDSNIKSLYVLWPDFIEKSKRFNSRENVTMIDKVKYSKSIIIDDLGHESISNWSRDDILFQIISYRLEKGLFTIVTSNFKIEELYNRYMIKTGDEKTVKSLVNKLSGHVEEIILTGKDLRLNQ